MPILELVTFSPSDAYKSDPEALYQPVVAVYSKVQAVEGNHFYHGRRVENPAFAQVVMLWSSLENHSGFLATQEYKDLLPKIDLTVDREKLSDRVVQYARFDESVETIDALLSSPICDFGFLRAKTQEALEDAKRKAIALTEAVKGPGYHGLVIGTLLQEEYTLFLIGGWDSLEMHIAAIEDEAVKEKTTALLATDSIVEVFHVNLKATALRGQ